MAKRVGKFLSYDAIKKMDEKKFNEKKTIEVEGYVVQIDKVFRNSKIYDMINHMMKKIVELNDLGRDLFDEVDFNVYLSILLMKYFTSIDIADDYEHQIGIMKLLLDNDMVSPIMDGFEESELNKVMEIVVAVTENTFDNAVEANKKMLELVGAETNLE